MSQKFMSQKFTDDQYLRRRVLRERAISTENLRNLTLTPSIALGLLLVYTARYY